VLISCEIACENDSMNHILKYINKNFLAKAKDANQLFFFMWPNRRLWQESNLRPGDSGQLFRFNRKFMYIHIPRLCQCSKVYGYKISVL
jgi:hypothetical protein